MTFEAAKTRRRLPWLVGVAIAALTLTLYLPAIRHDFVRFDDDRYVTANNHVLQGLGWHGARWAFTSFDEGNWHPLTWLSHMADVQLWGTRPGGHHLSSLLLHAANATLLFAVLRALTGALWRSAFVAALFAVHPLHVESVAWVAERKDVLSTFFLLLSLAGYAGYVRRRAPGRYSLALGAFGLGLLAKPMIVTLPLVLLLVDRWPLGRPRPALREKVPFFALAFCSGVVTIVAQNAGGSIASLERLPWTVRLANAVGSCAGYAGKIIWPGDLTVFYPLPETGIDHASVALGGLFLAAGSWFAWRGSARRPALGTGWLWYLLTLLPVIGIIQVGEQALADRYTYIPAVGLFLAVAWGWTRPLAGWKKTGAAIAAAAAIATLAVAARAQIAVWHDSETLFRHALAGGGDKPVISNNLGAELFDQGRAQEAVGHFRAAARAKPERSRYRYNLGKALAQTGAAREAEAEYRAALSLNRHYPEAHVMLGNLLLGSGRIEEALAHYREARVLDPENPLVYYNHGLALAQAGAMREAESEFRAALARRPDYAEAHNNLAATLIGLGNLPEAAGHLREAARLSPGNPRVHYNLGELSLRQGSPGEAAGHFREALRLNPGYREASNRLAAIGTSAR